jgi:hypothetical protein
VRSEYEPGAQGVGAVLPVPAQMEPAGQGVQPSTLVSEVDAL